LFLKLGLDADETKFASAQLAVNGLQKALELVVDAAQAVGDFFVSAIADTEAYGSKINDLSARSGIATDALQGVGYAAELSGSSVEGATLALEMLGRSMGEAKDGGAEAAAAFQRLGVRVTDAGGNLRNTQEVMFDAADALLLLPAGAERNNVAMKLFGRSAKELGALLSEGGAGIRAMVQEAKDLDLIMSKESVKAFDAFGDSLTKVHGVFGVFQRYIAEELVPVLQPMLDGFLEWWKVNREIVKQQIGKWLAVVVSGLKTAGKMVAFVVDNFEHFVSVLKLVGVAIGSYFVASGILAIASFAAQGAAAATALSWYVALGIGAVVSAAKAAGAWLAATWPLIALIAGLALLYLVIDDINVTLKGGDSILGRYGEKWAKIIESWWKPSEGDNWLVAGLKKVWWYLTDIEGRLIPALMNGPLRWTPLGMLMRAGKAAGIGQEDDAPSLPKPGPLQSDWWPSPIIPGPAYNGTSAFSPASLSPGGMIQSRAKGTVDRDIGGSSIRTQHVDVGGIVINPHPHQSPEEIGKHVSAEFDRRLGEALPVAGARP
jgi:hypothetical protein